MKTAGFTEVQQNHAEYVKAEPRPQGTSTTQLGWDAEVPGTGSGLMASSQGLQGKLIAEEAGMNFMHCGVSLSKLTNSFLEMSRQRNA